jgi:hypothetical protein
VVDLNEDVSTTDDEFQRRCPRMVTGGDRGVGERESEGAGDKETKSILLFVSPSPALPLSRSGLSNSPGKGKVRAVTMDLNHH